MFNMLVVDDERIEREGIKFLVNKYNLALRIEVAEDGLEALEFIEENPVDILFTDIKIPFIDGLELASRARMICPEIKVIIFSAYGEFEYAKRAIDIKAIHYILKPIIDSEFISVVEMVIDLCKEEEKKEKRLRLLQDSHEKNIKYEKERLLNSIINSGDNEIVDASSSVFDEIDFSKKYILEILLVFRSGFFDRHFKDFERFLNNVIQWEYEYLNINEQQSILFVIGDAAELGREDLQRLGENLKNKIAEFYSVFVMVIIGNKVNNINELPKEYARMETLTDYIFFFQDSVVVFTEEKSELDPIFICVYQKLVDNIYNFVECQNYINLENEIQILFGDLIGKEHLSSILIKFICADIVKCLMIKKSKYDLISFKNYLEAITVSSDLNHLQNLMLAFISEIHSENIERINERNKRLIDEIIDLINCNYMKDISLEWISDKVYLTPNYVSFIFKKEMNQSIVKYITSIKLEKAIEKLLSSNMRISDISKNVGYQSSSYFCLTFKSHFGISPAKYRDLHKKEYDIDIDY